MRIIFTFTSDYCVGLPEFEKDYFHTYQYYAFNWLWFLLEVVLEKENKKQRRVK